ncbi:MAG: heavy-metal-associated domain-containing protein [Verrucomicrobiota bacterium]
MKIPALFYLAAFASLFVLAVNGEARTWTRAKDKKKIEADFVKAEGDKVTINMKGKDMTLAVSVFSKEDQEFIAAQGKKGAAKGKESTAGLKGDPKVMPEGATSVVLSGAHLCCSKCQKRIEKAVERYDDVKLDFDKSAGTVTFNGESGQAVEDALFKVHEAGFYGMTDHARLKMKKPGGSKKEVEELSVVGMHVCCGKCEKAIKAALKTVKGIDSHTMEKGKSSFIVKGKVSAAELNKALNGVGLNARTITVPK